MTTPKQTSGPHHKISLIQLHPKPLQPTLNYQKACQYIRDAASQGSILAVLPEYHIANWLPSDPTFLQICSDWQYYLRGYQDLAKELNICIVPGTIVERHKEWQGRKRADWYGEGEDGEVLLNVAYFIGQDGEILGKYVKKNLWGPERHHLTSSRHDPHPVFDTPIGKVGLLICWDLAFPEAFRELISRGARTIIIPTFWTLSDCSPAGLSHNPVAESLFLDSALTSRAFENTCAVLFANAGGPPGRGYAGLTQACMPFVGPVARLGSCAEGMIVVDLDYGMLVDAESNYKVREDLSSDKWHYEYRHNRWDESKL